MAPFDCRDSSLRVPDTVLLTVACAEPAMQSVHCRVIAAQPAQRLIERASRLPGGAINKPTHRGQNAAINARQMRSSHVPNRSFTARLTNAQPDCHNASTTTAAASAAINVTATTTADAVSTLTWPTFLTPAGAETTPKRWSLLTPSARSLFI